LANGVNCDQFSPVNEQEKLSIRKELGLPKNKKIILHVGHLKANRNLTIFKEIQKIDHVQVVIVGGTTEKTDELFKEDLRRSGIRVFHEYYEDISVFYKVSDIYIFPTSDTGIELPTSYNQVGAIDLPLSVLEAMACNLPVITRPFGALTRLFRQDEGLIFCRTDTEILCEVRTVLRNGVSANTRQKVLPYNWRNIIETLEEIYRDAITNNSPA